MDRSLDTVDFYQERVCYVEGIKLFVNSEGIVLCSVSIMNNCSYIAQYAMHVVPAYKGLA